MFSFGSLSLLPLFECMVLSNNHTCKFKVNRFKQEHIQPELVKMTNS